MIYLAILLILTGLLIILVTLFLETRKVHSRIDDISQYHARGEHREAAGDSVYDPEDIEIDLPDPEYPDYNFSGGASADSSMPHIDDEIFISFDDTDDYPEESESFDFDGNVEADDGPFTEVFDAEEHRHSEENAGFNNPGEAVSAVMFDDHSGIIDYDSGDGIIDSTFKGYRNIKRVGLGELHLDSDGLNFYLDGRLYRFDFHRLSHLWTGKNYMAIPIKGGDSVKLFILDGGESLIKNAEAYYYNSRKD